jgi:hypothetical protein
MMCDLYAHGQRNIELVVDVVGLRRFPLPRVDDEVIIAELWCSNIENDGLEVCG